MLEREREIERERETERTKRENMCVSAYVNARERVIVFICVHLRAKCVKRARLLYKCLCACE